MKKQQIKRDKIIEKTPVIFYKHKDGDVFAFFPEENYNTMLYGNNVKMSYQHTGQHGACHKDYLLECSPAIEEEYKYLILELEQIGYNLQVLN